MNIGLIAVDSHNFPNIPLMKLAAYHQKRGDNVEWYIPLTVSKCDVVYISKIFSFSQDYQYNINASLINRGGSGYCIKTRNGKETYEKENDKPLPHEIEHIYPDYSIYGDRFINTAYGRLTVGCPRNCKFCHTTQKDGCKSVKTADISEFWKGQKNIILLDQNLLACKDWKICLQQLQDLERIYTLRKLGYWAYVMIYNKSNLPRGHILKKLQRYVNNRFVFSKVKTFEEYLQK